MDLDRLVLNVTGLNKLLLLGVDRVLLFPRSAAGVEWFERKVAAYRALATTQLNIVPGLLGRWQDPDIYLFPFAAVTRLRGQVPAEPEAVIERLGRAIACWHDSSRPYWPGRALPVTMTLLIIAGCGGRWIRIPAPPRPREPRICSGRPGRAPVWADLLASRAQLTHVLVHGDIHDGQLLADGGQLTGITDWETVRIDHPFWDLDLGQRGTGLRRHRRHDFSVLGARGWHAYARERGLDTDSRPLQTAFRLRHTLRLLADPGGPAVADTIEEHPAHL